MPGMPRCPARLGALADVGGGHWRYQVGSSTTDGFASFEQFLKEWSRRDFLRGMGGAAAFAAFTAGGLEFLEACGGGSSSTTQTTTPAQKGGHRVGGDFSDTPLLNSVLSPGTAPPPGIPLWVHGRAFRMTH